MGSMFRRLTMIILVIIPILQVIKQYADYSRIELHDDTSNKNLSKGSKTLILYAYFEKNKNYAKTLDYFIKLGVEMSIDVDYVFIIQGYKTSVPIPRYPNVKVLKRDNTCYDFGAYGKAIEWLGGINKVRKYDFFVFINPSAIGPILPKYWPSELHWSKAFTLRLVNETHACSTSIVCLSRIDPAGRGPRMEGMAFAATFRAVELGFKKKVFGCHTSKVDAVIKGEYGFSLALLQANLNFDTLLTKYDNVDWRVLGRHSRKCNKNLHPTRNLSYFASDFRMTVHPFETIFYKPVWTSLSGKLESETYAKETLAYLMWAVERKKYL